MTIPPFHIVLIGHRGSGKTALGRRAAGQTGMRFTDLDEEIERATGTSAAAHVSEDEAQFRDLELHTLERLLGTQGPLVIAAGGGLRIRRALHTMPALWKAFIIAIRRGGWEDVAQNARLRLKPGLSLEQELAWMRETREPAFEATADASVEIERGCPEEIAAERLVKTIERLYRAAGSDALRHTWILASSDEDLGRAGRVAELFPVAGIEIRSDLPTAETRPEHAYLASLRTADGDFFQRHPDAAAYDVDIEYIDIANLDGLEPRPLILSAHPLQPDEDVIDTYRYLLHRVGAMFPQWIDHLRFKYAPAIHTWDELDDLLEVEQRMRLYAESVTGDPRMAAVLPQGERWRWVRALLLHRNGMNYVSPPGIPAGESPPPMEYFLPYAGGGPWTRRYAVIGDPVERSIGSVWHMDRNIEAGLNDAAYYNIPVTKEELGEALGVLHGLGFKGLSVTAPLKRAVKNEPAVTNPANLEAGNTLTRTTSGWALDDRDVKGMDAVCEELRRRGVGPGTAAVFGRGGVSSAVVRSLEAHGWDVTAVSAREGWEPVEMESADIIVNASGPRGNAYDAPPKARAWVDLHYRDCAPPPDGTEVYISGMLFFEAQATAQRRIWGLE